MKHFKSLKTRFSDRKRLFGENVSTCLAMKPSFPVSASQNYHLINLIFFDNAVRSYQVTNNVNIRSSDLPFKNLFSRVFRSLFGGIFSSGSTECFMQPINQSYLRVRNRNKWLIAKASTFFSWTFGNDNRSFAVNNSRKISTIFDRGVCFICHKYHLVKSSVDFSRCALNSQLQRLSKERPVTVKRQSDLIGNYERRSRRAFPAAFRAVRRVFGLGPKVTVECDLFNNPGVQAKYKILLGQWLREKEDLLMRDLLSTNVVFQSANGGINADSPTEITRNDCNNIEQLLLQGDARTTMEVIQGENRFGTAPIRDSFISMSNTAITPDIQNVDGVLLKANYPSQEGLKPEEYASIGRFRFFVSSKGAKVENASLLAQNIYRVPMCGMEAYAKLEQNGYSARVGIIPNYAMSNVAQNYGMYAKFAIARAITNQNWISGLEVTKRL